MQAEGVNEIIHETTLFAEPIFHIGNFTVTNSLLSGFLTTLILGILFWFLNRKILSVPKGLQNLFEMILEVALDLADSITSDRKKSEKFLPLVLSFFLFILFSNWLGILPIVGTWGIVENQGGHQVFIPFLRGATADLNTTLALALLSVTASHVIGIFSIGFWKHLNKFINLQAIIDLPKDFRKNKMALFVNPIKAFVGLIEVIGEAAKTASLSLRLFGNIFAGEVLLASILAIFAFLAPLPFLFLEILVGLIQASVFSILTLVFLTMNSTAEEH